MNRQTAKDTIEGAVWVVGDGIDTDQIIPAEHLVYSLSKPEERRYYGRFAMSGVPEHLQGLPEGGRPFVAPEAYESDYRFIVAGKNFGYGSSREHAPFSIREAGVSVVIAETFARIFYRNAVDGGFLMPIETPIPLIDKIDTGNHLVLDVSSATLENLTTGDSFALRPLGEVKAIVEAGNVFEYARLNGLMSG